MTLKPGVPGAGGLPATLRLTGAFRRDGQPHPIPLRKPIDRPP